MSSGAPKDGDARAAGAALTQRYVIHLPVVATDLPAAQRLARVVGRWMLVLPQSDAGETTVSAEDDQNVRPGEHRGGVPSMGRTVANDR